MKNMEQLHEHDSHQNVTEAEEVYNYSSPITHNGPHYALLQYACCPLVKHTVLCHVTRTEKWNASYERVGVTS